MTERDDQNTTSTPDRASAIRSTRSLRWTIRSLVVIICVSVTAGAAAAIFGGELTKLGSGAGGLYGLPSMLTTLVALALATPAAIIIARQAPSSPGWLRAAVVISGGAWIVAIGYFVVAHAIDPCVNGWWDANSQIGQQPLCERFGTELNWHTRFHLLAHAAPAAVLLAGYVWALRHWGSPRSNDHSQTSPHIPSPPASTSRTRLGGHRSASETDRATASTSRAPRAPSRARPFVVYEADGSS